MQKVAVKKQQKISLTDINKQWCVRVIFLESQSQALFSQSRVESESWPGRVESQEPSSHFESLVCKLESMSSHTKFHVFSTYFCYEMAPNIP